MRAAALGTGHRTVLTGLLVGDAAGSCPASVARGRGMRFTGVCVNVARSDRQSSLAGLHFFFFPGEKDFMEALNSSQTPGEKQQATRGISQLGGGAHTTRHIMNSC